MALKALSKDEELAAVPGDQPVLVQLPEFADAPEADAGKDVTDVGAKTLQQQLDAMKEATALELKRERDSRLEAERRAEQFERERNTALTEKAETESGAVNSGLSAAQAEQASAKQALKIAGESGDWEAIGEAQARIARSASDIREFERAAAMLAEQKEVVRQPVHNTRPIDINAAIDGNPALLASERDWLKQHPEAFTSRNKEVDVAYDRAMRQGLSRGTPEYFKFMDEFMGYARKAEDTSSMTVSAPVHRNERDTDGRPSGGKIMLSPEQRDIAKSMGISDIEYARQVAAFEQARKSDPAKYGDR